MNNKSKGIEIVRQSAAKGIAVTSGGVSIDTQGKPISIHFEKHLGRVYLLIDCSGSMSGYKLDQAKQGIMDFARDAIRKEYLVGLIKFDSSATHICEPIQDINSLEPYLKKIQASGSTNMVAAIKMAHECLRTLECTRAILIATDGQPDDVQASLEAGQLAKDDGIDIITIGTDDADQAFLKRLASRADLGKKVSKDMFAKAIASASYLLPEPKKTIKQ